MVYLKNKSLFIFSACVRVQYVIGSMNRIISVIIYPLQAVQLLPVSQNRFGVKIGPNIRFKIGKTE